MYHKGICLVMTVIIVVKFMDYSFTNLKSSKLKIFFSEIYLNLLPITFDKVKNYFILL